MKTKNIFIWNHAKGTKVCSLCGKAIETKKIADHNRDYFCTKSHEAKKAKLMRPRIQWRLITIGRGYIEDYFYQSKNGKQRTLNPY